MLSITFLIKWIRKILSLMSLLLLLLLSCCCPKSNSSDLVAGDRPLGLRCGCDRGPAHSSDCCKSLSGGVYGDVGRSAGVLRVHRARGHGGHSLHLDSCSPGLQGLWARGEQQPEESEGHCEEGDN